MNSNDLAKSNTYVISIASGEYINLPPLPNALKDAKKIINALEKDYEVIIFKELHDNVEAILIEQTFQELQEVIEPEDNLLILYNGHGVVSRKDGLVYWQFKNCFLKNESTWYKCANIFDKIRRLKKVEGIALFVNACYSGNIFSQDGIMTNRYDSGGKRSRILFTSGIKEEKVQYNNPFASLIADALEKNKNNLQLSLRRIIDYTITNFEEDDFLSKPRSGFFREDEGGDFLLYSKNKEDAIWEKTKILNTIKGYENFIEQFPDGKYHEKAESNRLLLVEEESSWIQTVDRISSQLIDFQKREKLSKSIDGKIKTILPQIEKLKNNINDQVVDYEVWKGVRAIINQHGTSIDKKIEAVNKFITDYPHNIYREGAEQKRNNLIKKQKAERHWNSIPRRSGFNNIDVRRSMLYEHIDLYYGSSRHIDNAYSKFNGIKLLEKAILEKENGNLKISKALFNRYLEDFPNKEYTSYVRKLLDESKLKEFAEGIEKDLNIAIKENAIAKIFDVVDFIKGLGREDEKNATKGSYNIALAEKQKYELNREIDYEKAIKSNRIINFREFISKYINDEISAEYVGEMKMVLNDKDIELFNIGEYETKNIDDFLFYIDELGKEGFHYENAQDRVKELKYFSSLTNKEEYEDYLTEYKNGLVREEAEKRIVQFEAEEKQQIRFEEAINSNSIEKFQSYLTDYLHKKDERWEEINKKFQTLKEREKEDSLFSKINEVKGIEQHKLCHEYLSFFKEKYRSNEIVLIKEKVKNEIDCDEAFEAAVEIMTIESFRNFKQEYTSGRNHDKADDYIIYLIAKQSKKREDFQNYLKIYKEKNGLNIKKAADGLLFLDALDTKTIGALHNYLENSPIQEFKDDALESIKELKLVSEMNKAIQNIKNFEGSLDDEIKLCSNFSNTYKGNNQEFDEFIAKRWSELKRNKDDDKEFMDAKEKREISLLTSYMDKYGEHGRHFEEAAKLVYEIKSGLKPKDKEVLNTIKDLVDKMKQSENEKAITRNADNRKFNLLFGAFMLFMIAVLILLYVKA